MIRLFPMLLLVFSVGVGAETIKYENSKYVGDALNGVPHGHTRDQNSSQIMAEYSISF